jgi:ribosome assembly protein SQT1
MPRTERTVDIRGSQTRATTNHHKILKPETLFCEQFRGSFSFYPSTYHRSVKPTLVDNPISSNDAKYCNLQNTQGVATVLYEMEPTPEEMHVEPMVAHHQEDDEFDDTPEFIDMNDAVEIQVDDDMVMDEDDDDDVIVDDKAVESNEPVVDMSNLKVESHTSSVYSVACSIENGQLSILSGGGDDKAFLYRSSTSQQLPYNHTDSVSCVAFNMAYVSDDLKKTPRLAAVGSYDGTIVLYDPESAEQKLKLEGPSDVEWLCFHPKGGSVLLAGSGDGTVWMFHIPLNRCLQVFVGHEQAVTAGCFSPDGKWAVSASADGTVRIWAPKTGVNKHVFRLGEAGLTCMTNNGGSDGMLVMVGAEDGQAHVCHVGTKKVVATVRHFESPITAGEEDEVMEYPMSVEAVGFCPAQPNWCATGGVDGCLKIWDLAIDGQCRQVCTPEGEGTDSITRLKWHSKLPIVFTTTISGKVRMWDARNGCLLHTLTGHTDVINDMDIQFLDNGTAVIVSAGDDKSVRVFELDVNTIIQQATTASTMH